MICILRFGIVFVLNFILCELFLSLMSRFLFTIFYVVRMNFAVVILVQLAACVCVFI